MTKPTLLSHPAASDYVRAYVAWCRSSDQESSAYAYGGYGAAALTAYLDEQRLLSDMLPPIESLQPPYRPNPGDPVWIDCPTSTHHGRKGEFVEELVGRDGEWSGVVQLKGIDMVFGPCFKPWVAR